MDEIVYRLVGPSLYQELTSHLIQGTSVVLLGPRDAGKRYVLRRVLERLQEEGEPAPKWLDLANPAVESEEDLRRRIVQEFGGHDSFPTDAVTLPVEQTSEARRSLLFACNPDSLPHPLARLLLKQLQDLVKTRRLVVALTGESDLTELVHGPDSQFNCASQFVLQGFEPTEFIHHMAQHWETTRLPDDVRDAHLQALYSFTGGNVHHARSLLWNWLCRRAWPGGAGEIDNDTPSLSNSDLTCYAARAGEMFHSALLEAERAPATWRRMLELLDAGDEGLPCHLLHPEPLELVGLAVRRLPHNRLYLASPLVEQFLTHHYHPRRRGDLHAIHGDWDAAFECYRPLPHLATIRPGGGEDRLHLPLIIETFGHELHAVAQSTQLTSTDASQVDPLDALFDRFQKGCRYLLGFQEVRLLRRHHHWDVLRGRTLPGPQLEELRCVLPTDPAAPIGEGQFTTARRGGAHSSLGVRPPVGGPTAAPVPNARFGRGATLTILPSVREDRRDALIVGDCWSQIPIARERRRLLRRLTQEFESAYRRVIADLRIRGRLRIRDQQLELATDIFRALGQDILNPMAALEKASDGLIRMGYSRVMFSLVDSERRHVDGVLNRTSPEVEGDLAEATHYHLAAPVTDIQQWVVVEGKPRAVPDWSLDPLTNKELSRATLMKPLAVVPMLDVSGRAVGTIHVERSDGMVPTDEEIADLIAFGKQLAVAIGLSERLYCLQQALNEGRKAVALVTPTSQVIFANESALPAAGLQEGANLATASSTVYPTLPEILRKLVPDCFRTGTTQVRIVREHLHPDSLIGPVSLTCEPVLEWRPDFGRERLENKRRRPMAAGVFIRDFSHIHRVFLALQAVAKAASTVTYLMEAVTAAAKQLGFPSARFYRFDADTQRLISQCFVGSMTAEEQFRFSRGEFILDRREKAIALEAFLCFERMEPVLYHLPDRATRKTPAAPERNRTKHGVEFHIISHPSMRASWTRPGCFWLDIPLHVNGRNVGKLTLDFAQDPEAGQTVDDLVPEQVEMLRLFTVLLPSLLDALEAKEEADQKALATVAHNLRQPLASIRVPVRNRLDLDPDLSEKEGQLLRKILSHLKEGDKIIDLAVHLTHGLKINRKSIPLVAFLDRILAERVPGRHGPTRGDPRLHCSVDELILGNAIKEILQNSEEFCSEDRLWIEASVEPILAHGSAICRIRIGDNGPGIDPRIQDRLFVAGVSLRPPGMARGHGLGLSFVAKVVRAHGGIISIDDRQAGAEFLIDLPLSEHRIPAI